MILIRLLFQDLLLVDSCFRANRVIHQYINSHLICIRLKEGHLSNDNTYDKPEIEKILEDYSRKQLIDL